jgi:transcriptional regulator with XRE-family HTH domain
MTFGERLREIRKSRGLSQRELADKVKLNFTYLSKVETGTMHPPSEKTIMALAKALETDSDELLALAKKMPSDLAKKVDLETIKWLRSVGGRVNKPEDWGGAVRGDGKR